VFILHEYTGESVCRFICRIFFGTFSVLIRVNLGSSLSTGLGGEGELSWQQRFPDRVKTRNQAATEDETYTYTQKDCRAKLC
jgi:hypothetical protein